MVEFGCHKSAYRVGRRDTIGIPYPTDPEDSTGVDGKRLIAPILIAEGDKY